MVNPDLLSNKDVLIVEDDANVCKVLKTYCQNLGIFRNIIVAEDGVMASKKLANQEFYLILLDLNIPKRMGQELLTDFNSQHSNSLENVLVVSGVLDQKKIADLVSKGVSNFLVKPFDEDVFKQRVEKVLKLN